MNHVIIVAGGKGERFSYNGKKQFYKFRGKTLLELTIEKFDNHDEINNLIVVLPESDIQNNIYLQSKFKKITSIVKGGSTRFHSVYNGLKELEPRFSEYDKVLIHDGVRPLVTNVLISNILSNLDLYKCVVPGIKLEDTVKKVDACSIVTSTIERDKLFRIQTPQGFKKDIFSILNKLKHTEFSFTDDASIFEHAGFEVKVIQGEKENIKITTVEDLDFLRLREGVQMPYRTGFGYDVHKFMENRKLILGGVEIPFETGLEGHSDADVVIHSIIDALLGALGKGDIGEHFPDNNEEFRNINSLLLLQKIYKNYIKNRFAISNIDVTIVCEAPKLKNYKGVMRKNISDILEILQEQINIKATTTEQLGFTGRKEGIAAYSTVLMHNVERDS